MGTQNTVTKLTFEIWKAGMQAVLDCSNRREAEVLQIKEQFSPQYGECGGTVGPPGFSAMLRLQGRVVTTSSLGS